MLAALAALSFGEKLTMDEAIRLAKRNNGSLKAAQYDLIAAKSRKAIAAS